MKTPSAPKLFTLAFGLFLGLCVWKFGNPVILDHQISAPISVSDYIHEPWPLHWANWILLPLACWGLLLVVQQRLVWSTSRWLWLLPCLWLGWQFVSATHTVDADLTEATLWQFCGCLICYFLGALMFSREDRWCWLLPGLLAAFAFCLVRGVDQHVYEYPATHQMLVEGEHSGWTNFPPATIAQMKADHVIIRTNGMDVANPVMLKKFHEGRVSGTLVYPNALAGIVLLLWPVSLAIAVGKTKDLKPLVRLAAIAITLLVGGLAFYWSGSKLGWLIGMGMVGLYLLRLNWSRKLKFALVGLVMIAGLGVFAIRFHHYFAKGATSVVARFDYWHAALQTTATHPVLGTGPGTFQHPYERIKSPEAEMARLTHNDYLEQFSDSGVPGGVAYVAWIFLAVWLAGKKFWISRDVVLVALLAGVLGWFIQGVGEFSLYIPALAWTAFTLLGLLTAWKTNQIDK